MIDIVANQSHTVPHGSSLLLPSSIYTKQDILHYDRSCATNPHILPRVIRHTISWATLITYGFEQNG
jgi:hypothetical protein